jgi:formylglycine-generating enzyme required for sulfatase activity
MVVIPAGSFRMGSPDSEQGRDSDEGPVHTVRIDEPFALARREVSVGQFRAFVEATGYRTEAEKGGGCYVWDGSQWGKDSKRNWRSPGFEQGEDHPVVCVSWNDARAYVGWLGKETGQTYRLPSEAEWEYAARAGTTTARFWVDSPDAACRYANVADRAAKKKNPDWTIHDCDDGFVYTAPVGSFEANAFGLRDMLGNAGEWTEDCWNDSYKGAPADGRAWVKGDCGRRVVRGGSWSYVPDYVRSANRFRFVTEFRYYFLGFRPARTL